ncbi:FAD-binding and (Fe-S)-binding domain-containing protein [Nocardiopsis tropica]|uniref:FAD-binding and (Fe-S)-binding domain-containing protein n=1 Tax=Nocardiopsis tropica TaxID=109330 RepID=A0ABU7KWC0_9ACTN|nr:FAD-binding and (Fe-S)-binding domain-containing protein [Nocardiopsis umidischolae]MEE2053601.1 FAD-binding and (Fe-S)-binding domain-containing protein [Nocardiopsis umidischolae]
MADPHSSTSARTDVAGLRRDLESSIRGTVSFDAGTRALYTSDASNYRRVPLAVVVPETVDDCVAAVRACAAHGVPVVPRGGGTSIAGNAIGTGVVIDTSRHLRAIEHIDPEARTATVQPGVILDDLRAATAEHGLTFAPDPSTHSRCTIGGMVGNNACGSHSVAWGTTADNIVSLDLLLSDGTRLTVGSSDTAEEFEALTRRPGREGEIHTALARLVDAHRAELRTAMPEFRRRVSGYALDRLLPEKGRNVAAALVGTEGTCAFVLGATVRLVESPPARALAVLGYPDAASAADAVPDLLGHAPLTVEGINDRMVAALDLHGSRARVPLPEGGAWLLVEIAGPDPGGAAEAADRMLAGLPRASRPQDAGVVSDPAHQRALWRIREEGAGLTQRTPAGADAWSGWEDAAVPPENLGAYLRDFDALMERHGRFGVVYGHFGDGCLHVRIDFELTHERGRREYRAFMEEAADTVVRHGGSLSGEHGDGQARSELLARMYPEGLIRAFGEFKRVWDPVGLMNPGIIVDPLPLDADIRVAADTVPSLPSRQASPGREATPLPLLSQATLAYGDDGGDPAGALRRCSGIGKCRRQSGPGVMCPSYQVTQEEKHSTRGRAHLLFEMARGEVVTDGWRSEEVRESLDLCLSCKGCLSDCPVNVDMASYKAEFLHQHYRGRVRPAAHYSMGWLPLWARMAALAPAEADRAARLPGVSRLAKRVAGVAAERDLPSFARTTFTRAFRRRAARGEARRGGPKVVLWPDTFGNHMNPGVPAAAVRVLEDAGFTVVLPRGQVCCGLTWVSTGQLDVARAVMRRAVRALAPLVEEGLPVVGLEPSCTAALRHDLLELLPGPESERVAASVHTLAGFLEEYAPDWQPPRVPASALAQVHCHQHAVIGFDADRALIARAGIDGEVLDSGCCGLAGDFGFTEGRYEVSRAIGERELLPRVREAAPETLVLADGYSCRTQIAQGTGRRALHLAEVLARGLDRRPSRPGAAPEGAS